MKTLLVVGLGLVMVTGALQAGITSQTLLVQLGATVTSAPAPQVVLSWKNDVSATSFTVYRRPAGTWGYANWGTGITVAAAPTTTFTDDGTTSFGALSVGAAYEYRVEKVGATSYFGNIWVGIDEPAVESRGKLILMVDDRFTVPLAPELKRLEQDMIGDGWEVITTNVSVAPADPARPWNDAPRIKAIIQGIYDADSNGVNSVFLFGHFPIPYSGKVRPDGHLDHFGAWPADMYYGDMNGTWSDTQALADVTYVDTGDNNKVKTLIPKHVNMPGDGKFDQSSVPDDSVELAVGRVDLFDMPAFRVGEQELLRRYLDKDHAYRHRAFNPLRRGLYIDGFGNGTDAYRNQSPAFGSANVLNRATMAWVSTLSDPDPSVASYLWAHGAGGGQPTCNLGVGTTTDHANNNLFAVFYTIWGSYNGVWDYEDSLLRAPLASQPWGLTCILGKNYWNLPEMGLGRPIGFSVRRSQCRAMANLACREIYHALMGDPTLRLFMVAPPTNVTASGGAGNVTIAWGASGDAVLGYHVFRSVGTTGAFTRLTGSVVSGTNYTDIAAPSGTNTYRVHAVKRESVNSGTYYNLSQGIPVRYPPLLQKIVVTTAGGLPSVPTTNALPSGSYQTLAVPADTRPGAAFVCTWTGTGSVPSAGQGSNVTVFLDQDSTIQWQWTANQDSMVTVTEPASNYTYRVGAGVALTATASDPEGLIAKVDFEGFDGTNWVFLGSDRDSVYYYEIDDQFLSYHENGQPNVATYRANWTLPAVSGPCTARAKAYDCFGQVTISAPMTVTLVDPAIAPAITRQPVPQTVSAGECATFTVEVSGTAPFTYLWQWQNFANPTVSVSYVDFPTYTTIPSTAYKWAEAASTTRYRVVITNTMGSVTSDWAILTVTSPPPAIVTQPSNLAVSAVGQPASFQVVASGPAPLVYQWRKNGVAIPLATNATATNTMLYIAATASNDINATFSVMVTYAANYIPGTNVSAGALLTVAAGPPTIVTPPGNQTVIAGQTATFSVVASGAAPLFHQWRANGLDIGGATNVSHTTAATTTNDNGTSYAVVVSNAFGSVTSVTATLTVNAPAPPVIITPPANQSVAAGQTATFNVTASGTPPLFYQWRTNGGAVGGAVSASYTTPATSTNDNGTLFSVVVSNIAGNVTSSNAVLTVTAASVMPAITGQPSNQTVTAGQAASFSVTATGTLPLYYQWRTNGAAIGGATDAAYTTGPTVTNTSGTLYSVVVSNVAGSVTSSNAVLTVNAPAAVEEDLAFSDSFEGYAPGASVAGSNGWTGDVGAGVVTAVTYQAALPPGYPLPWAAHSQVLRVTKALQRAVPGRTNENVTVDFMLQPTNGMLSETLGQTVQMGLGVDTQGVVRVWHSYSNNGAWTRRWTALGAPPSGTGRWVRVSIAFNYGSNGNGHTLFRPALDGTTYATAYGVTGPTDLTSPGAWYVCADSPGTGGGGARKISGFKIDGDFPAGLDDFLVTTGPLASSGLGTLFMMR